MKVYPGNYTDLAATHIKARDPTDGWSTVEQQINSIQADLRVYEAPLLTVRPTYQHSSHPLGTTLSISRTAAVHRCSERSRWHSSPRLQTKLFTSPENSAKPAVSHGEYAYRIPSQKVASIYSNPDCALSEIKDIRASGQRAAGNIDLHDISRELAYKAKMVGRFLRTTAASASNRLVDCA